MIYATDPAVVLDAVQQYPLALEHARRCGTCRPHGCSCGCAQRWAARCVHASNALRADPAVVLDAVQDSVQFSLEHARGAALALRADLTVVLAAVRKDGRALRYASDDLRTDPAVVLDAVQQYPLALEHAAWCSTCRPDGCSCGGAQKLGCALRYASDGSTR